MLCKSVRSTRVAWLRGGTSKRGPPWITAVAISQTAEREVCTKRTTITASTTSTSSLYAPFRKKTTHTCHLDIPRLCHCQRHLSWCPHRHFVFAIKIFKLFALVWGDSRSARLMLNSQTAMVKNVLTYSHTFCSTNLCNAVIIRRLSAGQPES